jgi:hypothetical protein
MGRQLGMPNRRRSAAKAVHSRHRLIGEKTFKNLFTHHAGGSRNDSDSASHATTPSKEQVPRPAPPE